MTVVEVWECPEGHTREVEVPTPTPYEPGDEAEIWCEECKERHEDAELAEVKDG